MNITPPGSTRSAKTEGFLIKKILKYPVFDLKKADVNRRENAWKGESFHEEFIYFSQAKSPEPEPT